MSHKKCEYNACCLSITCLKMNVNKCKATFKICGRQQFTLNRKLEVEKQENNFKFFVSKL